MSNALRKINQVKKQEKIEFELSVEQRLFILATAAGTINPETGCSDKNAIRRMQLLRHSLDGDELDGVIEDLSAQATRDMSEWEKSFAVWKDRSALDRGVPPAKPKPPVLPAEKRTYRLRSSVADWMAGVFDAAKNLSGNYLMAVETMAQFGCHFDDELEVDEMTEEDEYVEESAVAADVAATE